MPQLSSLSHGVSHGASGAGREGVSAPDSWRLSDSAPKPETACTASNDENVTWTEQDVVHLHCLLLGEIRVLADPNAPLDDMLDVLRWVFTEPENDDRPFSFASCLRIAGCSLESTFPFFGCVDVEEVRMRIRHSFKKWFEQALARYPQWVRDSIRKNPGQAARRLARNPQCINQQLRSLNVQNDLFA
jgi:hypothetical protein